jgi:hypothetical protein
MIEQDDILGRLKLAQVISDTMNIPEWYYEDRELVNALRELNKICYREDAFISAVKGFFMSIITSNALLPFSQRIENRVTVYRIIELYKENKDFKKRVDQEIIKFEEE